MKKLLIVFTVMLISMFVYRYYFHNQVDTETTPTTFKKNTPKALDNNEETTNTSNFYNKSDTKSIWKNDSIKTGIILPYSQDNEVLFTDQRLASPDGEEAARGDKKEVNYAQEVVPNAYPAQDADLYHIPPVERYPGNIGGPPPLELPASSF